MIPSTRTDWKLAVLVAVCVLGCLIAAGELIRLIATSGGFSLVGPQ